MAMAHEIALTHHENWDGTGYPYGLSGTAIPLSGRIVAVIDSYDAMTNDRPYRDRMTHREAVMEVVRCKGGQFDPAVVDGFLAVIRSLGDLADEQINVADWISQIS
jgi:response regulator RpfG family c-di-GMP phosphodiesterase